MAYLDETGVTALAASLRQHADETYIYPIFDRLYPVGSIYISTSSTDPATLFGGTWRQIEDTFLLAAGQTYTAGDTGGEAEHTLTVDEMPSHSHNKIFSGGNGDWPVCDSTGIGVVQDTYAHTVQVTGTTKDNFTDSAWTTNSKGGGQSHNNMPPYLAVYVWERLTLTSSGGGS